MFTGINISHIFVLDQDKAYDFYVNKLGLEVDQDLDLGFMRWLTVRVPGQPGRSVLLEQPGPPAMDEKTAAGIEVPAKAVAALGSSKRPPVRATVNGFTYRSTVAVMGGKFMLGVSNEVRKSAGVAAGDTVDIDLELDTEAREVSIPSDFAAE